MHTAPRSHRIVVVLATICALALAAGASASDKRGPCRAAAHRAAASTHARHGRRCSGPRRARVDNGKKPVQPPVPQPQPEPAPSPEPPAQPAPEPAPAPSPEPEPLPEPTPEPEPVEDPTELQPLALLSGKSLYWGAWIKNSSGEAPWSMSAASKFEGAAGKHVSMINWSSPFYLSACNGYCTFQTSQFEAVRSHGSIPFFSWNPGPGGGEFSDARIAAGSQDKYITAWAKAAKAWGHPFFLRFAWEMNGSWFPWGVGNNGTTAADFVAMWRHVHDVFASVGASNVTWVWCPNVDPAGKRAPLGSVYPGPAYVDWTCLDGYNGNNPWRSFSALFKTSYEKITGTLATQKPMVVGETASTENGGAKARWIADMLAGLPTEFPKIRGLLWFDKVETGPGGYTDWPIESSAAATSAFAAGIAASPFEENVYGSLATSPIPAP
jgi:Glycosyl hydrolase family 26